MLEKMNVPQEEIDQMAVEQEHAEMAGLSTIYSQLKVMELLNISIELYFRAFGTKHLGSRLISIQTDLKDNIDECKKVVDVI
jgi:hypothetical protein|tara:strand:- start:1146 stop:1391 length:246 start_codon:yes stop_codon:yes gene_type:complete